MNLSGVEAGLPSDYNEDAQRITREKLAEVAIPPGIDWTHLEYREIRETHNDHASWFEFDENHRELTALVANTIRKFIITQMESMSIHYVTVFQNNTEVMDQVLCNRLGTIPLLCDPYLFKVAGRGDKLDASNSLKFRLHIKGPEPPLELPPLPELTPIVSVAPLSYPYSSLPTDRVAPDVDPWSSVDHIDPEVTPDDLPMDERVSVESQHLQFEQSAPSSGAGVPMFVRNVPVIDLGVGQEIEIEAIAVRGKGATNCKWTPTNSLPFLRGAFEVTLEHTDELSPEVVRELVLSCPKEVFDIEEVGAPAASWQEALQRPRRVRPVVRRPQNCNGCRQCEQVLPGIQIQYEKEDAPDLLLRQQDQQLTGVLAPMVVPERTRIETQRNADLVRIHNESEDDRRENSRYRLMRKASSLMYSAKTGLELDERIGVQFIYNMRLQKFLRDQFKSRTEGSIDPWTGGPSRCSTKDRPGRMGYMERDGMMAGGASRTLVERFLIASDFWVAHVCRACKTIGWLHVKTAETRCSMCRPGESDVVPVTMPFVLKNIYRILEFVGHRFDFTISDAPIIGLSAHTRNALPPPRSKRHLMKN